MNRSPSVGPALPLDAVAEARVRPASPVRLPRPGRDPCARRARDSEDGVERLIHLDGRPAVLEARAEGDGTVALRARAADDATAREAMARLRFWTGVDDDLTAFLERFAGDPLIGPSVRSAPWLRPYRRPMPFEVLAGAICEQLITDERADAVKRALVRHHGVRLGGLVDFPDPATLAGTAPAALERCGLAAKRSATLVRVAREVAAGRVELLDPERGQDGWRRLRTIPGVGSWTLNTLALHGQGHHDALPAGDHAYRTLVGEVTLGRPGAKVDERAVLDFFTPYAGWRGVAGWHLLRTGSAALRGRTGDPPPSRRARPGLR